MDAMKSRTPSSRRETAPSFNSGLLSCRRESSTQNSPQASPQNSAPQPMRVKPRTAPTMTAMSATAAIAAITIAFPDSQPGRARNEYMLCILSNLLRRRAAGRT